LKSAALYAALLHRQPDPKGLRIFLFDLDNGMSQETAGSIILGSAEYYARAGM